MIVCANYVMAGECLFNLTIQASFKDQLLEEIALSIICNETDDIKSDWNQCKGYQSKIDIYIKHHHSCSDDCDNSCCKLDESLCNSMLQGIHIICYS